MQVTKNRKGYIAIARWVIAGVVAAMAMATSVCYGQSVEPVVPRLSVSKSIFFRDNPAARDQFVSQLPRRTTAAPQQPAQQQASSTGTWQLVSQAPASGLTNPRLLTDGTVIFLDYFTGAWYKLTPDIFGNYVSGTWCTNWSMVGTGDFNGDGKTDIVWRDTLGDTSIWLMNGAAVLSAGSLGNIPTIVSIVEIGDYNGDGMSDLLWRDNLGNTSIWFMNGTLVGSTGNVGNIPPSWTVQSVNAE
jgi:FG-GAP repeat